jgi:tRNA nucleotidyltransferase/poly(A) polymerase
VAADVSDNHGDCGAAREDALAVVRRLRESGHVAYFAGGCVRDMLLGFRPKDYDVATDAPPNRVRALFPRTQAVGAAFGVILVRQRRSQVEVATFRTDLEYRDGRRPEGVRFATAEEDAKRRDFTINGLFLDPVENRVIDYVGGQEDLKNKVLRAIGDADARFAEDHLRLLRAIRFAARFGLTIDSATDEAIARNAPHLVRISPERIAGELRTTLTPPTRASAWQTMRRYALDGVIFRFLRSPTPSAHPEVAGGRAAFFERVSPGTHIPFGLALAAAAVDHVLVRLKNLADWPDLSVRQTVRAVRQSLRISNEEAEEMEGALYGVEQLLRDANPRVATLKRFLARPTALLSRALLAALPAELAPRRDDQERRLAELEKTDYAPPPLITGDDLTGAGLTPGPVFKQVLDEVYDAQLEGRVTTKDEALRLALAIASRPPET